MTFISLHFQIHAESETVTRMREAYKKYREIKKEAEKYAPVVAETETEESYLNVCAGCPTVIPLTGDINKVMRKMIEEGQIDSSKVGALEEIERLEAMYYLVHYDIEKIKQTDPTFIFEECTFFPTGVYLSNINPEPLDNSRLTEIFTFSVPLDRINSVHYRSIKEKGRYYFYRAAYPHEDKIIQIHVPQNGEAQVTYFQLDHLPTGSESALMKDIEREKTKNTITVEPATDKEKDLINGMEYWGSLTRYKSETSEWDFGVAVAHKKGLPRKIILLQGKDQTDLGLGIKMNSAVEVSDRDQEVRVGFGDEKQEYFRVKAEADGDYKAEIPFQITFQEFDFGTTGTVAKTNDGEEANLVFTRYNESILRVSAKRGVDNSEAYTIGNDYHDVMGGTVSLDYKKQKGGPGDSESVWLRYSKSF